MYYAKHFLLALIPGILLGLAGFSFLQTTGILDGKSPQGIRAYVITSGSMQPTIPVGSVIINQTENNYSVGDIVTFSTSAESTSNVTHRIVGISDEGYITKGDANQDPDPIKIPASQIQGKSTMHIPYIGYLVNFSKTPQGFVAVVVIPATIVIYEELKSILRELKKVFASISRKRKNNLNYNYNPQPSVLDPTNIQYQQGERGGNSYWRAAVVMPIVGLVFIVTALSASYFSDIDESLNNILGVATDFGSTPSPSPSPSATPDLDISPSPTPELPQ